MARKRRSKIRTNPQRAGIACVYQELNIEKLLSITDNIFINKWIKRPGGLLDYKTMHKKAKEVMASLGQDIDRKAGRNLRHGRTTDD